MLVVSGGMLIAQDTIKTLIITEAKMDRAEQQYIEITNVGDVPLNLSDFEFSSLNPWNTFPEGVVWPEQAPQIDNQSIERLPDMVLAPGESFVIGAVSDFTEENYARDLARFGYSQDWGQRFLTNPKLVPLLDLRQYQYESPGGTNAFGDSDSISTSDIPNMNYPNLLEDWGGRCCFFIRHHISPTDSAVVDQVGGLFTDEDGTNPDGGQVDVAGVTGASGTHYLMRRYDVTQGNTEFVTGTDLSNSEWIPIPMLAANQYNERLRGPLWTVGNHVNATLEDLTSDVLNIDLGAGTIEVPWGVRNNDSIMGAFNYTPGIAWHYDFAPTYEDSAFVTARSGDVLTLFAVGETLDSAAMTLVVLPPTASENRVVPKYMPIMDEDNDDFGTFTNQYIPYQVTDGLGLTMDTISEIPFATRTDTLAKYLEKAPNASWEFVWVDGNERTDLMEGDLLRVTAEDGSVKDYYLDLQKYRKGRNSDLSSITWPDIPEFYKGLYGWVGDTIPSFASAVQNYVVEVPADVDGIPALVGKTADENASVDVQRAVNLFGSTADRTVTFTVAAENDTTIKEYLVELVKQKASEDIQPWLGEPFISQFIFRDQWSNTFLEIVNPGTELIDLSEYMLSFSYALTPAEAITANATAEDFDARYSKYIPGRIWGDTTTWAASPGIAVTDQAVVPIVYPGDVFVLGDAGTVSQASSGGGYGSVAAWPAYQNTDIFLTPQPGNVPEDEKETAIFCPWESPANRGTTLDSWYGEHIYLFKIIGEGGDSVRNGLKPATDPNDFLLLDTWGGEDTEQPSIGGEAMDQIFGYTRKPGIYQGNPEIAGSWGTDAETSEWIMVNRPYFNSIGVGWPIDILRVCDGLGSHFMDEVTVYKSTVTSNAYKVSQGYSMDEEIRGATTGTTVDQFVANVNKVDEGQTLTVKSAGVEITGETALTNGDSLMVMSADSTNTSMYFIEVTDDGLSDDAVLTSDTYTVTADDPAQVGGFEIGTLLADVVNGVTVPAGATLNVINSADAYVPLKTINFDTMYVDVLATSDVWFEVIAEDGVTKIVYQLMPDGENEAYVTSSVFEVDQNAQLIKLIPEGTTVNALLSNLVPAEGATWVFLDKLGYERTVGMVVQDDQLVVTAADGVTTKTYYLAMLGGTSSYLAYVVSDVYTVNQDMLTISGSGVTGAVSVTDFLTNLIAAEGASLEVQDNTGAGKAGADMLADDDQLQVTAGNGVNMVMYAIELDHTSIDEPGLTELSIYPNPTADQFYIEGLEPGLRVRVYNAVGVALRNITAFSSVEQISLGDQPNGMYYITISNGDDVIGRYKVIKQ